MENIILIAVTLFLAYRLYDLLGKHSDTRDFKHRSRLDKAEKIPEKPIDDQEQGDQRGEVIDWPAQADAHNRQQPSDTTEKAVPANVQAQLKKVAALLPDFDSQIFLDNATAAFEMILGAFTRQDEAALEPLLSPDVLADFTKEIKRLRKAKQRVETRIVAFESVQYAGVSAKKTKIDISVTFVTRQISVLKDEENRILDGDPHTPETLTDVWTFTKDPSADEPTWYLASTAA